MLKGHGLRLHSRANTGTPVWTPYLQDCLCVVSFVRYTPVLPVGCFLGPSHFHNCILVLLGLVASWCTGFDRSLHHVAGLCVLGVADVPASVCLCTELPFIR